ncbi:MAG: type I DNA topoisomerase [Planctomycetota bacterium]
MAKKDDADALEQPADGAAEAPKKKTKAKRAKKKKALVIVESPAKARTINKYLGSDYVVRASMGHIRDLPKGKFGIHPETFEPDYIAIRGKGKVVSELKKLAKSAGAVYLAPDMDREGEAIAWHLAELLEVPDDRIYRVVFNEITKNAILSAFDEPGRLDMDKVDAQQARRVLDRIMGYKLSPLLWKKIAKGLSAGRVQSVAVRLIVERELEIRAFVSEEYWRVSAAMAIGGAEFQADLRRLGATRIDKNLDEKTAKAVIDLCPDEGLVLAELEEKPKTRRPTPPFTTSQLQQKASTMLRFSARKTMMIAQQLYEGVEIPGEGSVGLITYMRTDSTRVSNDALAQVRDQIVGDYGPEYLPDKPNAFKTKSKGAQEAHEAIRPTNVPLSPTRIEKSLSPDQLKLYRLIWEKFVASQMKPAVSNVTTATFEAPLDGFKVERNEQVFEGPARFIAQGEVEVFDGHLRVFSPDRGDRDTQVLPALEVGKTYKPKSIDPSQHFTQPPPRFTEATLVKELEKRGIGRPSTYATIISTIQDRGYVNLDQRRFHATELGEIVNKQLVGHFDDLINTEFTSMMESNLDRIEAGERKWAEVVKEFNTPFLRDLEKAEKGMKSLKENPELSEIACDKCGAPMAVLYNKRGKFLGCSKYPDCKNTLPADGVRRQSEAVETDYKCPKCESPMVIRDGKRGRFLACTAFPKCRSTASVDDEGKIVEPKKTGIKCEKCESEMIIRGSRRGPFLACSAYPKCRNAKPLPDELREKPKETGEMCETCGKPLVLKRSRWGKEFVACSGYPECKYTRDVSKQKEAEAAEAAEAAGAAGAKEGGASEEAPSA